MANNFLRFLVGAGQGIEGARKTSIANKRQAFLDELEKRKVDQGDTGLDIQATTAGSEAGYRSGQLQLGEQELGLKRDQFLDQTRELMPGGFNANFGGKLLHFPGRLGFLEAMAPIERQYVENTGRLADRRLENDFRVANPAAYGHNDPNALTPDSARMKLLLDVGGNPTLGEQPGAREAVFNEMVGLGQHSMPDLFGQPPADPTQEFFHHIADDSRFKDRDSAQAAISKMIRENPQAWAQLDHDQIHQFVKTLPRGSQRRTSTKQPQNQPANPRMQMFSGH